MVKEAHSLLDEYAQSRKTTANGVDRSGNYHIASRACRAQNDMAGLLQLRNPVNQELYHTTLQIIFSARLTYPLLVHEVLQK